MEIALVKYFGALILCNFLFISSLQAQQAMTVNDVELKSTPSIKSETVKELKADTAVNIIGRQGGWYQVEVPVEQRGWLKMLWLRFPSTAKEQGTLDLLAQSASGVTVATGIRGLSDEELEKGKGSPFAMSTLDRFVVSPEQAQAFADAGGLQKKTIPYVVEE